MQQRRLETAYAKARARAEKKGRPPPKKEEVYYDHWGYPYLYMAPYAYPLWWTPGMYCGWYPGYAVACGGGAWAACAAGTCGGGVAAGACGGPGVSTSNLACFHFALSLAMGEEMVLIVVSLYPRAAVVMAPVEREWEGVVVSVPLCSINLPW
jgi:hypothetical protein